MTSFSISLDMTGVVSASTALDILFETPDPYFRFSKDTNWIIGGPTGAAARLGVKRTTLNSLVKRLGIDRPS